MPVARIPSLMRDLTGGKAEVEVAGETVRDVVNNLEKMFPGIKKRLVEGGQIKPGISVFIDGDVTTSSVLEPVGEHSEVHFLPRIGGGCLCRADF